MLSFISYIFLFGFLVAPSVAFTVSVPSSVVTAGQNGTVTWTRNPFDLLIFTLTLHDVTHNTDGHAIRVASEGKLNGLVTFNFPDAGTFQITASAFPISVSLDPLPSSKQFLVNASPPPQSASSQASSATSSEASSTSTQASNVLTTIPSQSATSTSSSSDGTLASSSQSFATDTQSSTAVPSYDMNTSATDTTGSTSSPTASATAFAKSPVNTGAVIGGVLGALAFIILLAFWVCRRRRKQKTEFFRDMMIRRKSQALLFSQATVPSMRSPEGPVADVADVGDPETAGGYERLLGSASMTGHRHARYAKSFTSNDTGPISSDASLRTSMSPVIFSPIAPPVNSSSPRSLDIQHATWTHRQVMIHDKVIDLQAKLIAKQSWSLTDTMDGYDVNDLKNRIARLEQLMLSAWALGFTDETPEGLD